MWSPRPWRLCSRCLKFSSTSCWTGSVRPPFVIGEPKAALVLRMGFCFLFFSLFSCSVFFLAARASLLVFSLLLSSFFFHPFFFGFASSHPSPPSFLGRCQLWEQRMVIMVLRSRPKYEFAYHLFFSSYSVSYPLPPFLLALFLNNRDVANYLLRSCWKI